MTRTIILSLLGLSLLACSVGGNSTRDRPTTPPETTTTSLIGPHAFDGGSITERDKRCQQTDAIACLIIGDSLRHGTTKTKVDTKQARAYYELACEYGNPTGCAALAIHLIEYDLPTPNSRVRTRKLLTRACELDEPSACTMLAELYTEDALQAAKYRERAEANLSQACASDDVVRCHLASLTHSDAARLDALCEAGYAPSCLTTLTLTPSEDANPVATWRSRRKPLERLCEDSGVTAACLALNRTYSDEELAQDEFAKKLYFMLSRAQQRGDSRAYKALGNYYKRVGQTEMARTSYRVGCEDGLLMSCNALIFLLLPDSQTEGTLLMKTYLRACELGERLSCAEAAGAYEQGKFSVTIDEKKALDFYGRACQDPEPLERACEARARLRTGSP